MSEEKKIDWFNMTKEEVTRMISRAIACDKFSHVKVDEKFAEDGGDNRKTKFFATYMVFDGQNSYLVEIATAEANISSDWQVYAYFEPKSAELKFEMSITNLLQKYQNSSLLMISMVLIKDVMCARSSKFFVMLTTLLSPRTNRGIVVNELSLTNKEH